MTLCANICEQVQSVLAEAKQEISSVDTLASLEQIRVAFLGKKGKLTVLLHQLGQVPQEDRPIIGDAVNKAKQEIIDGIERVHSRLTQHEINAQIARETLDVTLSGRGQTLGSLHPVTRVRERVEQLFTNLGFVVADGPEIENEYYNFTALNIPAHHPARAMHDTFYVDNHNIPEQCRDSASFGERSKELLLRTHTSPVQIRFMQQNKPPLRIIAAGRVYRRDSDVTHTPMFHQIEGLVVEEGVTFSHLKGILQQFLNCFFEKELPLRFRPSYFPFTEPSAEVDMQCVHCEGKGCRICSHTGWLEILGCGMVHPNVFQFLDIDSERFTGYAFGLGLDRLAMLRYGITDLRTMFESDIRFLQQF